MLPEAAAGRLGAEPPLWDEDLRVGKLGLVMKDRVMTQVELSLKKRGQMRLRRALLLSSEQNVSVSSPVCRFLFHTFLGNQ